MTKCFVYSFNVCPKTKDIQIYHIKDNQNLTQENKAYQQKATKYTNILEWPNEKHSNC